MARFQQEAKIALQVEGNRLLGHMRREIHHTTHGGAPGKPEWRSHMESNLQHGATVVSDNGVSMEFGYYPDGQADMVRAMIVEEGSGSAVNGDPIHAGPTGRAVWDDELSGKHPSRAKSEYDLPAEFNQQGNQFVENAMRIMESEFGEATGVAFATIPDSAYYGNVQVDKA